MDDDDDPGAELESAILFSAQGQRRSMEKDDAVTMTAAWRSFPSLAAPLFQIGLRVMSVGNSTRGESRTESRRPPPLYIAQCDRGPPTIDGLGSPDQGARSRPNRPLGLLTGDQSNILLLDLILYFDFNF